VIVDPPVPSKSALRLRCSPSVPSNSAPRLRRPPPSLEPCPVSPLLKAPPAAHRTGTHFPDNPSTSGRSIRSKLRPRREAAADRIPMDVPHFLAELEEVAYVSVKAAALPPERRASPAVRQGGEHAAGLSKNEKEGRPARTWERDQLDQGSSKSQSRLRCHELRCRPPSSLPDPQNVPRSSRSLRSEGRVFASRRTYPSL